ncbi:intraflagellar transport protein [Dunaliella salina]|uniref:Intraflagellar transport protein 122 homolog n=1 Tax=Dunaliella salina TaxID=3046 RepID=A0ABQ7H8M6_DUNSA|nr:intraflagellar transport protein [Dunaliella salina]|eukprot:KAF5843203.1 intraflagellar transport protein [Dunaliella salina]
MRTVVAWQETPPEKDGIRNVCYDLCFKPDGTQLVAGVGNRVLVYDAVDGDLLHALKGHKDSVYCVAYALNGKRFASGGADNTVIIWTSKAEGILKYTHNESIQALAYNPITQQLASATAGDVGLWSPEQKSVAKHKVSSRICALSWTPDGHLLAMGCFDGSVIIRDKAGTEKTRIETGTSPVWAVCWNPSVRLWSVQLYTRDGTFLTQIASRDSWVWCVRPRPRNNFVALGCEDGTIACYQLIFSTVHGLYHERYAYRDQMTDVIIQHLITEQKVRIKCKDYVKKIAVYKDKLAVQLSSKVVIYELANPDDPFDMHYQSATKIQQKLDCNLLVVTSSCVILCQERKLQLLTFDGDKEREWVLDSVIRYIKVVGGPVNREGLLVGLKSGQILKIFVDNPFPIPLIKHTASVRCLDLSASRNKLAVVDENANVLVFNLITKEKMFEEKNANSVAWNTEFEDMFCYSGNGMLSIKTSTFPLHQQKLQGFVVGFKGSKIFCLHLVSMQTIDVPQSASMYRYLEKKDVEMAYKTACLGVTEADWRSLALETLQVRFSHLNCNAKFLSFMSHRSIGIESQGSAMEMFSDLRQFDEAKKWAEEYSRTKGDTAQVQELINKQAEWSEETKNFDGAAEMYIKAKKYDRAIAILAKHAWWEKLITVVREVPREDKKDLNACVHHFRKAKQFAFAKETLLKLDDTKGLISLYVEEAHWEDAFLLLNAHPEASADVYLPYAKHLLAQDKFDDARQAYDKLMTRSLRLACWRAVREVVRHMGNALYYIKVQMYTESCIKTPPSSMTIDDRKMLDRFSDLYDKSEVYYAYSIIYKNVLSPFKAVHPVTLFNCARFLLMRTLNRPAPLGVSMVHVVYTLARHAMELGAFKLARFAYNKLQTLVLPPPVQAEVDVQSILVRARPFHDAEELLPVCYRCSTTNPLLNTQGDYCINCGAPFIRSFVTFEHLPLVEFELDAGISDEEAKQLLGEDAGMQAACSARRALGRAWVPNQPIVADRATLRRMKDSEVMVRTWPNPHIPYQFFRVMDQEVPFVVGACGHFYEQDEYEMEGLEKGHTPFSREPLGPEQKDPTVNAD